MLVKFSTFSIIILGFIITSCISTNSFEDIEIPKNIPSTELEISYENYLEISKSNYLTHWFSTELNTDSGDFEAKIRIQGGISKHALKKSYKLTVYEGYPAQKSHSRIYSAQFGDPTLCRLRVAMHIFKKAGFLCPEIKPTHLFFEDWFQGIYLEIEPLDEFFFINRGLPITSFYFSHPHARFSLQNGYTPENVFEKKLPKNSSSYNDLRKLFIAVDNGITENDTTELSKILDIKNALDYYTISVLIKHADGITNNLALYFNPNINKFQFIPWDLTATFKGTNTLTNPSPPGYVNNLFDQMIKIDAWNKYCQSRIKDLYNAEELDSLIESYKNEIEKSVLIDPTYPLSEEQYQKEVEHLATFIKNWEQIIEQDSIFFVIPSS